MSKKRKETALYQSLYLKLFNQITEALREIQAHNYGRANDILVKAQIEAEEEYLSFGE